MIKLLVLILIFVSGCSKNSDKSLFKSEILDKEKKPFIEKSLFKKELLLNKNFNGNLKINLPNQISQDSNSYLKNNQGRNKFDTDKEKIKKYKFKKIKNFDQYESNIVFDDTGVIFFDGSGSIIKSNFSKEQLWKKNFYSKKDKKSNPFVFLEKKNNILIAADNFANYYRVNPDTGNLIWKKVNSSPFNSQIKIFKDKFYIVDLDNKIHCFSISNGKKKWSYQSENFFIKSKKKLSIVIDDGKLFFNNSIGDITALNLKNGELIWQTPTQNNLIFGETILLRNSELVINDDTIIFSNNNNKLYSIDKNTGFLNWVQNINSDIKPVVISDTIFTISNEGFLFIIEIKTGNIIKSKDLFEKYKNKKRDKIKPVGMIIGLDNIYATFSNGKLLIIKIADSSVVKEIKIDSKKISKPFVFSKKMFIAKDDSIVELN